MGRQHDEHILEWSFTLEDQGILGENLMFTEKEKDTADVSYNIGSIENFQGVMGNVQNSNVTQRFTIERNNFDQLRSVLKSHNIEDTDIDELEKRIDQLEMTLKNKDKAND